GPQEIRIAFDSLARVVDEPQAVDQVPGVANPSANPLRIAFTLTSESPARLELFAVNGRRVMQREVGSLGPGPHVLELQGSSELRPGVYWIRLMQDGRKVTAKGVVFE